MISDILRFSPKITAFPIVHGNGDFAVEVRRIMLNEKFDCVAVPLPPSFKPDVEKAIAALPTISVVTQESGLWSEDKYQGEGDTEGNLSYVPVDPCQGVITALRIALQERIPRAFIDLETDPYEPYSASFPDAYALKKVAIEKYAAAMLPALPPLPAGQPSDRAKTMAFQLRELEHHFESILFVCSLTDWPWIRQHYLNRKNKRVDNDYIEPTRLFHPRKETLFFMLGELPYITWLYERARRRLEDDENLTIDGVKEMLIEARRRFKKEHKYFSGDLSPQTLSLYLKYVRNLSLIDNRLTPDLYTLTVAAKQMMGDGFALELIETAREYGYQEAPVYPEATFGINKLRLPDGRILTALNRLAGPPLSWGKLELKPRPLKMDQKKWKYRWNPHGQCSHFPEDDAIERFRSHVVDTAKGIMRLDLSHSEKFTTSLKDGVDIRETLRHFYSGDVYVKINPPVRGDLDTVVMLFDAPVDPRKYPWRTTWHAEHDEESTLAFFATNYLDDMVGPGIARAQYGGAVMVFPPIVMQDIWTDKFLDFTDTLEERILAAACLYSKHKSIALLSPVQPNALWRKIAARFGKKWIHIPTSRFSTQMLRQLRIVHVLNGKTVRSYADYFIRKA